MGESESNGDAGTWSTIMIHVGKTMMYSPSAYVKTWFNSIRGFPGKKKLYLNSLWDFVDSFWQEDSKIRDRNSQVNC